MRVLSPGFLKLWGVSAAAFITGLLMAAACYASAIVLPKTWQTKCYDTFGSEIACGGTGQDGDIQAGMAWPVPRFANKGDGTVKDRLTGLIWLRTIYTPTIDICKGGKMPWKETFSYVECLNSINFGGYSDWRVPNVNEMRTITRQTPPGNIFTNVRRVLLYATSTTYARDPDYVVTARDAFPKDFHLYVLPVRGGTGGAVSLPKTNQTKSFFPRDDGDLKMGVEWPSPRFADNGDSTITDNLTGLIWTRDSTTPGPAACGKAKVMTWQGALDFISCLNANSYLGRSNWRLPNINELGSLLDFSRPSICLPADHPFTGVRPLEYWSSSSDVDLDGAVMARYYALAVNMLTCSLQDADKDNEFPVWPVSSP